MDIFKEKHNAHVLNNLGSLMYLQKKEKFSVVLQDLVMVYLEETVITVS